MNEQFLAALQAENLPVSLDESLGRHTTFRIGGNADFFCVPATVTQLTRILELCRQYQVRTYLLGNGSNTLFSDAGFGGAVICLTGLNSRFSMQAQPDGSTKVLAPAGMMLSALCNTAQKESLAGLEFAFGIPGTVGGAVYMNAGAYGGEIKDVLTAVTFLDENLHLQTLPVQELQLGYRTSIFERCSWCILEAEFTLHPGDAQEIHTAMQEYMRRRKEKQPLEYPSAGSTFKRPVGQFAGKLIEDCGLRGFRVGGAAISEKHCGFVVNLGNATCADVVSLTEQVRLAIEMLEEAGALETLPKPLQQAARLRMQYPEMPLAKLAEKFDPPVSKAGLSHRFKRIQEAAARLNAAASAQPEEQENPKEPEPAGQDIAPSPQ